MSWYDKLAKGQLEHWKNDHHGRLAIIIIGELFALKMFKGTPKAYALNL